MNDRETDVLVVGGGPVGLTCAAFTGAAGVETLLIDRRKSVSYYPKARALTTRSLEIFRQLGVEQAVYDAMPATRTKNYAVGGSLVSQELRLLPFGLGSLDPREDTPCFGSFCTQDRLEPILEARLRREHAASIRFGTELIQLEQTAAGVTATTRDVEDNSLARIRAKLLVGADGARSDCAILAGIGMTSPRELDPAVTVIFKARLSHLVDPLACVYLLLGDPRSGVSGMMSGVSLARDPEEWSMVMTGTPDWGSRLTDENRALWCNAIRQVVGIPDLDVEIATVAQWSRTATVAERLVQGRVVLVGDSAHLMPPAGGLGMNTGLQDAHNLAWRLAAIIQGSSLALLNDYERERLPEIRRAVDAAVANYHQGGKMDAIWNKPQVGLGLGAHYAFGSFVTHDDPPPRAYPYHEYRPSGRPGGRAPHFWLDRKNRRSVLDLFGRGFALIIERSDAPVRAAVERIKGQSTPFVRLVLGDHLDADEIETWRLLYEVDQNAAVLVRPDGIIAWRSVDDDIAGLTESLDRIMHRRVGDEIEGDIE